MPKVIYNNRKGLYQAEGTGIEFGGSLNFTGLSTIDANGTGEAVLSGTIGVDTNVQLVTQANNANDRVYLPSPTAVPNGHTLFVIDSEGTGFELSSKGDGTTVTTINGTAVTAANGTYAAELAFAANTLAICTKSGANAWSVGTATMTTPD